MPKSAVLILALDRMFFKAKSTIIRTFILIMVFLALKTFDLVPKFIKSFDLVLKIIKSFDLVLQIIKSFNLVPKKFRSSEKRDFEI